MWSSSKKLKTSFIYQTCKVRFSCQLSFVAVLPFVYHTRFLLCVNVACYPLFEHAAIVLVIVVRVGFEPTRFCITDFRGVIFVLVSFRQPSFDATNHTCYRHNPFSRPALPFCHPTIKKIFLSVSIRNSFSVRYGSV